MRDSPLHLIWSKGKPPPTKFWPRRSPCIFHQLPASPKVLQETQYLPDLVEGEATLGEILAKEGHVGAVHHRAKGAVPAQPVEVAPEIVGPPLLALRQRGDAVPARTERKEIEWEV